MIENGARLKMNFFTMISLLILSLSFQNCHKERSDSYEGLLALLGLSATSGEYYDHLYYIHPLFFNTMTQYQYVVDASAAPMTQSHKKLILVHGWDPVDRDNAPRISIGDLKIRAISFWTDLLNSNEIRSLVNFGGYDLLIYDYLTSNSIDLNGSRFRNRLDTVFSSQDTVAIFAHSMGGLVTRFAVYKNTKPIYLKRIITAGTPFHGSPWASSSFQGDRGSLASLAAYFTNTDGGMDLAYDNFDGVLSSGNAKLSEINAKSDRDDLFIAYYGSCDYPGSSLDCATALNHSEAKGTLTVACPFLYSPAGFPTYPSFSPSDCIVPATSARLDRTGISFPTPVNVGKFDHFDIKLGIGAIRQRLLLDLP